MSETSAVSSEVRLAQEIARQFPGEPTEQVAEVVAAHMRMFWAPPMIDALLAQADKGAELGPVVTRVVDMLR